MIGDGTNKRILGIKGYGSIPHLPGSRRGPADRGISEQHASIATTKVRDRHDWIIVQEKLDGANVGAVKVGGQVLAISRSGYLAETSPYPQHHAWGRWVARHADRFAALLDEGERVMGEWMMQAHGTRYDLRHEPFVPFDIMREHKRATWGVVRQRAIAAGFSTPYTLHEGGALSVADALASLGEFGHHGALDPIEGAVWRVERKGAVDFLCKYVRSGKVDGCYLESVTGGPAVLNWTEA